MDRYTIEREIAESPCSTVVESTDATTGKTVIMEHRCNTVSDDEFFTSEKELAIVKQLDHPCIAKLIESFEDNDESYFVFEKRGGKTLREVMEEGKITDEIIALHVAHQLLSAIAHLHEKNIVHKNIKPENILVDEENDATLFNFGIAQQLESPDDHGNEMVYSREYAAPEVSTKGTYDLSYDIWSLGVVLYELSTGHLPFKDQQSILNGEYDPMPEHTLKEIIESMLRVEESTRPPARELCFRVVEEIEKHLSSASWSIEDEKLVAKIGGVKEVYTISSYLGKDAYSEVKLCVGLSDSFRVALKDIKKNSDSKSIEGFENEAAIIRQLDHPNVVRYFGSFETEDSLYMVMECEDGGNLEQLLAQKVYEYDMVKIFWEILLAVAHFHEKGIIHKYIKPTSVMFDKEGNVKLGYYGLIQQLQSLEEDYASPEFLIAGDLDFKYDIWSLGTLFYKMCSGELPFYDKEHKLNHEFTSTLPASINENIKEIILTMLEIDSAERPSIDALIQSFKDKFKDILENIQWDFDGKTLKRVGIFTQDEYVYASKLQEDNTSKTLLFKGSQEGSVVLKQYIRTKKEDEMQGYQNEVCILRQLNHPNVIKFRGSFETNDFSYVITDYFEGSDLQSIIEDSQSLNEADVVTILRQLLNVLVYLHKGHIVYKKLAPAHIFVDSQFNVKLVNFSSSEQIEEDGNGYETSCNRNYAPPELFIAGKYDTKYDIWSLGVILYQMCVGKMPFKVHHRNNNWSITDIPASMNKTLRKLILSMLKQDPQERPAASELLGIMSEGFWKFSKEAEWTLDGNSLKVSENGESEEFQVGKTIGKGGFGKVNLCISKRTGLKIVLKSFTCNPTAENGQKAEQQFKQEIKIMKIIEHPNIVKFLGSFEKDAQLFIVMECEEGGDLEQKLTADLPQLPERRVVGEAVILDESEVVRIIWQILSALAHLQEKNIVHKDIKPNAVMFDAAGNVKLGDYGTAEQFSTSSGYGNDFVFTMLYCGPEILKTGKYDMKYDIWSVGTVLYRMLAGELPFSSEVSERLKNPVPELPSTVNPTLKKMVKNMLEKDPTKRKMAKELLKMLQEEFRDVLQQLNWSLEGDFLKRKSTDGESLYERMETLESKAEGSVFVYVNKNDPEDWVALQGISKSIEGMKAHSFERQASAMRRIDHKNIVKYLGSFQDPTKYYIVMEHAGGGDLDKLLKDNQTLEEADIIFYMWQILSAVAVLHGQNIVHKDIKPKNILLDLKGNVKLGDFGLAKILDSETSQGVTKAHSEFYAAPELFRTGKYDTKYDIWSLGVILYQMCAGKLPFKNSERMMEGDLEAIPKNVNSTLKVMIDSMLQGDPTKRPSAKDLLKLIQKDIVDPSKGIVDSYRKGRITLKGEGFMENYLNEEQVPWVNDKESIDSIDFPRRIMNIGSYSFSHCPLLEKVVLPKGLLKIAGFAFYECEHLRQVIIPDTVKSIGDRAFCGCVELTDISPLTCVESIGEYAFAQCAFSSIALSPGMSVVKLGTFYNCVRLESVEISKVTAIEDSGFYGCFNLTQIEIFNARSIGKSAFQGCAVLFNVALSPDTEYIGQSAFEDCQSLCTFAIPQKLKRIEDRTFFNCGGLCSIRIPEGVTTIGESAFEGCEQLNFVQLPSTLTEIGPSAFEKCITLTTPTLPQSLTKICKRAFLGCKNFLKLKIPDTLKTIEQYAFSRCDKLETVQLPQQLTSIRKGAFSRCSSLVSIAVPESIKSIEKGAFKKCTSLSDVKIPDDPTIKRDPSAFTETPFERVLPLTEEE